MDAPRRLVVRDETPHDAAGIRHVIVAAFKGTLEADIVDALRGRRKHAASLVAVFGERVVGHVLLTDVRLGEHPARARGAGVAPLAVRPIMQGRGIGSVLMRAAIDRARTAGYGYLVLLGDPAYYRRFGFVPAAAFGLACEYDAPPEAFMALELRPNALAGGGGVVRYEPEFRHA